MAKTDRTTRAKALIAKYHAVFGGAEGRAVLYDLMSVNFVLSPTIGETTDLTLVHEGQRNAILRILTILKTDPESLLRTIEGEEGSHVD